MERQPAWWTYDEDAHAYYFAPTARLDPPYRRQVIVEAILDIANDGTLAGVEIIHQKAPLRPSH